MWANFAFLFLFFFTAAFFVSSGYHHVNEVFNAITHDYLYHATLINLESEEVYFAKDIVREIVADHFKINLRVNDYDYVITFYADGKECNEDVISAYFRINLQADLGFNARYDKTFSYYLT